MANDLHHMRAALGLARRGLGRVAPNPAVGCVLVKDDRVVGRGWTQPSGRPHAETEALARAGEEAKGATAYVTLEPCDHHGRTPPCSQALVDAGIVRCVVAVSDPDPRVAGQGIERLAKAGIAITTGVLEEEAARLNAGFFLRMTEGRPLFTCKVATTLDGRIATHTGNSQWITGGSARAFAHKLRAEHDAVMIGIGTALADDARLTCRLAGMEERSPIRIVADSHLRLPLTSQLVSGATETPTWIVTLEGADAARRGAFEAAGVRVIETRADAAGRPDMKDVADLLGAEGLTRVLVEGGGHLIASLLRDGLADEVAWFHAPRIMGGDGIAAAAPFGVDTVEQAPAFVRSGLSEVGGDILETYRRI